MRGRNNCREGKRKVSQILEKQNPKVKALFTFDKELWMIDGGIIHDPKSCFLCLSLYLFKLHLPTFASINSVNLSVRIRNFIAFLIFFSTLTKSEQLPPEQYSITIHRLVPFNQDPWYLSRKRGRKRRNEKWRQCRRMAKVTQWQNSLHSIQDLAFSLVTSSRIKERFSRINQNGKPHHFENGWRFFESRGIKNRRPRRLKKTNTKNINTLWNSPLSDRVGSWGIGIWQIWSSEIRQSDEEFHLKALSILVCERDDKVWILKIDPSFSAKLFASHCER